MISACLLGIQCSYKATASADFLQGPLLLQQDFELVPVCPEQLGGMPTPRIPSELVSSAKEVLAGRGRVLAKDGRDVTDCFIRGAGEVLRLARLFAVELVVLKTRSPSCGLKSVYDGTFSGKLIVGSGVTARLLLDNGFKVLDEQDLIEFLRGTV
ncbi:MAG TPA: DUF523 domain-containing protein [Candidatus Rifleibacterium sp.]|nr:DUF523 domain-containing protein [Candidatus Rifleibacterium sp.]HPT47641.1 DUF523 domain-containing protein [Candidatus Rifleibacterium sp.]